MLSRYTRRSAGWLIAALAVLMTLVIAAPAAAKNPPGNNGTVKVDNAPFDNHPDNEPHVDCMFQIDFYGFDAGDLWADVTFEAHPPTGHGVLLTDSIHIGEDDNGGGGSEAGHDASRTYDLTAMLAGYAVHPQQGYHVKMTINSDGSQGADTKHKVFWVGPCGATPNNPPSNPPEGGLGGGSGTVPPRESTAASTGGPSTPSGGVKALPDTAMPVSSMALALAVLLMLSGAGVVAVAIRRDDLER